MRIGFGNDIHRLEAGNTLVIGGVRIDSDRGAVGHSDADVLLHAVTDAVLGALALGDIGAHFPNSDPQWKDADSSVFLAKAVELAHQAGYSVANVDSTISLESPKLRPYIDEMRGRLAELLGIEIARVSVKAKTGEGVDAIGRREAIRAEAVVLLERR
ncbi:MAG TPA: 2-C-methyl-D-erythritol 2,4-cyclodiphosphate synthase [Pyrinomonadaceae bacterium]|nr:2-C-methyl-D-erythritol 2,4-cyclodiphosphate synthase [Pyrinomonadaceae bacterium]